ncbi:MAG: hypothetical protein GQ583_06950 [Methyloprofundus sp.]|nr:hypothetical protein [Methyloprofundus sp.]
MRIIVVLVFLFFGFMRPAIALTKCVLNGKVSYKVGACPKNASSKYWVKNKFVAESELQKKQQENISRSEKSFKRMNEKKKSQDEYDAEFDSEEQEQEKKREPKKMEASSEVAHFQLKKIDKSKTDIPKVNVPQSHEYVNDKLSDMQKKLDQHNKELQQLQQH